jgi:hypothetical protein
MSEILVDHPLVLVEWEDATLIDSEDTWVDRNEPTAYTPHVMQSVGFLLFDGPEGIILTDTLSPHVQAPRDQIPRGMIRAIHKLRRPKLKGA